MKKSLKLFLTWNRNSLIFDLVFMQLPTKKDSILKKRGCKKYAFIVFNFSYFKIVLTLLTKVITFYIEVPIVQVWIFCFERPIQNIFLRLLGL